MKRHETRKTIQALAQSVHANAQSVHAKKAVVVVTGGRDYKDADAVAATLGSVRPTLLVHGGAAGADTLCHQWAKENGVPTRVYPAPWKTHGKAAGALRNEAMIDLENPDLLVVFPGDRGTGDMVKRAKAAGIPIRRVDGRFGATIGARIKVKTG